MQSRSRGGGGREPRDGCDGDRGAPVRLRGTGPGYRLSATFWALDASILMKGATANRGVNRGNPGSDEPSKKREGLR